MSTKTSGKNLIHTILVLFVLINIIGDIGNVAFWWASPSSQGSIVGGEMGGIPMTGGYLKSAIGADATLIVASVLLIVVAVVYLVALFGLLKKQKWGALLVIVISVVNRVIALFLFEISGAFAFWGIWTVILVVAAYLDYRKLSSPSAPPTAPIEAKPA